MFNFLTSSEVVLKCLLVHQTVDEEELEDVQQHSPERDLQRPQVGVGCEERDEAQGAEDVRYSKQGLSH